MFETLFQFLRQGVKTAILGGIQDAQEELAGKLETHEPLVIESQEHTNGKAPKRKAVKR